jgi:hypothetical protein
VNSFTLAMVIVTLAVPSAQQQNVQALECRDMKSTGSTLAPDETAVLGKACRPVGKPAQGGETPHAAPTSDKPKDIPSVVPLPSSQPASTAITPATSGLTADVPKGFLLEDGTPVHIVLDENVSSADAVTGQTVAFEVVDEVIVNGFIVIPRGSTAWATITDAQHKRRMGRAGHVDMNIDKVRLADGEKVLLRAVKQSQGGSNTGKMVGAMAATAIFTLGGSALFLLVHGKDTIIPKGTAITAFVQGNVTLDQAHFHRQPVLQ